VAWRGLSPGSEHAFFIGTGHDGACCVPGTQARSCGIETDSTSLALRICAGDARFGLNICYRGRSLWCGSSDEKCNTTRAMMRNNKAFSADASIPFTCVLLA